MAVSRCAMPLCCLRFMLPASTQAHSVPRVEALAPIGEARPDVVLLDLDLGDESGLDGIASVLAASSGRILVLTGVRDAAAHETAIRAGALGVVGKEIPTPQLLEAIRKVHRGELTIDRQVTERLLATIAPRKDRCVEDEKFAQIRLIQFGNDATALGVLIE